MSDLKYLRYSRPLSLLGLKLLVRIIIKQITILSSPFRLDNNRIMVENYGESIQDRSIPNPVTTFAEAYADYRELSHCIPFFQI